MLLLGMVLVLWGPLVGVIVASRWRTSPSAGRRRFGRALGFFCLWAMFNISTCATWGAFRHAQDVGVGLLYVFVGAQLVVPWLCGHIIATAQRPEGFRHG